MFKHLLTIIYVFCLITVNFGEKIIEIGDQSFVKHRDTTINLFKENVFESKRFEFDASTFKIPLPDFITTSENLNIYEKAKSYAIPLLEQTNDIILDSVKTICSKDWAFKTIETYDKNDNNREKREPFTIAIVITVAVISVISMVMSIKSNNEIRELRDELIKTQAHLQNVTNALNNLRRQFADEVYLSNLKDTFSEYIHRSQNIMLKFIKLLTSRKTIELSEIPDSIKKHLNEGGSSSQNSEKFYLLRLKSCSVHSVIVEITSAEAKMIEQIKCNKYTNMGYFSNNFTLYNQYILPSLYCYKNNVCSQVDTKNCIEHHVYSIVHPTKTVSKNVPPSGIFTTVINEADSVKIGEFTIRGKSPKATYIESIIDEKFEIPEIPKVQNIEYNYTKLESHAYGFFSAIPIKIVIGISSVFSVIALLMVIVASYFGYKKCCGKAKYAKVELVVNQNKA
uniref:Envelope protein n=1 Tax=Panagrolaimus davidi TaxID=227884 RepID=A0A914QB37_9BILA